MYIDSIKRKIILLPKWITIKTKFKRISNKRNSDYKTILDLIDSKNLFQLNKVVYKDETWSYIKNLGDYRNKMKHGIYLQLEDNACIPKNKCIIDSKNEEINIATEKCENNWICFFTEQIPNMNYVLSFDASIEHPFTELQISFRYKDLGNRYRFMIRDNREAVFEVVYRGEFYHRLIKFDYALEYGRIYQFIIIVENNKYLWYIDGNLIIGVEERDTMIEDNKCGLILYNATAECGIDCSIRNIKLRNIRGGAQRTITVICNSLLFIYRYKYQARGEVLYA